MIAETANRVECFSGHAYAQRPVALEWQGQRLEVAEIEAEWHTPEGKRFRIRTTNRLRFELHYLNVEDEWVVEAH